MPKKVSTLSRQEQPLNWTRAILSGIFGSWILMAIIDIFAMMGVTNFCMEIYLGSIIRGSTEYEPRAWIIGFFANWVIGGLVGILYAFCFESVFQRSSSRLGTALGLGHAIIAALAIFPFFEVMRSQMGIHLYHHGGFGFFGSAVSPATPLVLLLAHLAFGACMGTFYGPVRAWRIRAREFEPGEHGQPGEIGVIGHEQDPEDKTAIGYY